jgi:hypothetical protein
VKGVVGSQNRHGGHGRKLAHTAARPDQAFLDLPSAVGGTEPR